MNRQDLDYILNEHRKWVNKEGGKRAILRGRDFSGLGFSCLDLRKADFSGCNFSKCNFQWANFSDANLKGVNFQGSNLFGVNLLGAELDGADFRGADIDFSCWPLICGSLDVKLCDKLKRQLLYHVLAVAPEFRTPELIIEANKFHCVGEYSVPELKLESEA